jgi:hypothetical protein
MDEPRMVSLAAIRSPFSGNGGASKKSIRLSGKRRFTMIANRLADSSR